MEILGDCAGTNNGPWVPAFLDHEILGHWTKRPGLLDRKAPALLDHMTCA
jgi:hypothetical protein